MPKVLIVEDNADARDLLALVLTDEGFTVVAAENGLAGLALAKAERPDLIVTDISMPILDGVEMIKQIREVSELKNVPIVAVSAYGSGITADAVKAGASKTMRKPMELTLFLALLKTLLAYTA
jgi:CheY-like chemotaxis protein